jgi:predicted dehydrogenase
MEPLKMGVVGLGIRGFWIAHLIQEATGLELTAVADMNPETQKLAKGKFPGLPVFETCEQMAAQGDLAAVVIATSDRFHAPNAREALAHGKHVLIEKPMGQSFDDLREIARLKQETGLKVGTFLELRHAPLWKRVKAMLEAGEIGSVLAGALVDHVGRDRNQFFGRAKARSREMMVSLVLQKGVHGLDLLNWFMDDTPCRVSAAGALRFFGGDQPADKRCRSCADKATCPHALDAHYKWDLLGLDLDTGEDWCVWSKACDMEDVSFVNIDYVGGGVATYNEVHFAPYYRMRFTLYGDKGQMDIEANHDTGEAWIEITDRFTRTQRRERPTRDTGHGNADSDLLLDFAKAIREGREPLSGIAAGMSSAAIGIATRLSIDEARFVDLPRPDGV